MTRPARPRPAGPGRAGGGLNELPRSFSVVEAQRLVSALGPPERVRSVCRWADAFVAAAPLALAAWSLPSPPTGTPAVRPPVVASTLRCDGCGAMVVRHTAGGGGRPRKCRECGAWMRVAPPGARFEGADVPVAWPEPRTPGRGGFGPGTGTAAEGRMNGRAVGHAESS